MSRKKFGSVQTILAFLVFAIATIILLSSIELAPQPDALSDIQVSSIVEQEGIRIRSPLPSVLPKEYRPCITDLAINTTCSLPLNSSFKILGILGRGAVAIVYSVLFDDDTKYAMKFNWGQTNAVRGEYDFLYRLHSAQNSVSLNVPWLHPLHPPYFYVRQNAENEKRKFRCFVFIEQLQNSITWDDMEQVELEAVHDSILHKHRSLMNFYYEGYRDIMQIFDECHKLYKYHNDFHEGNLLINRDNYRFYLIDFGDLFTDDAFNWFNEKSNAEFKCVPHTCPPPTWFILHSVEKRNDFLKQYNIKHGITRIENVSKVKDWNPAMDELTKYAQYSKRYELISILLHGFIHFYCIKREVNDATSSDLLKMNTEMRMYRNVQNRKGVIYDDALYIRRWCMRQKMIKIFEKYSKNSELHHPFWKLMGIFDDDQLYLTSSNCSL